ncbi:MAG: LPS assembly lipoprotein LptE [Gammaproteobacteria bacterium]
MKKIYFSCLFILLTCTACGFHLRGSLQLPQQVHSVYIESEKLYDPFVMQLNNELKSRKVIVVKSPKEAQITIHVLQIIFTQALRGISANTQVRTYSLAYSVLIAIKDRNGKILYGPQFVSTTAPYMTSDAQLLGDIQVKDLLRKQMQHELISQIFQHIYAVQGQIAIQQLN